MNNVEQSQYLDNVMHRIQEKQNQHYLQEQLSLFAVLPNCPEDASMLNNYIAKSSIFLPRGKHDGREMLTSKIIFDTSGITLLYTGMQLDIFDQDVYLHALKLASGLPPDTPIELYQNQFLKAICQPLKGDSHTRLQNALERLRGAYITMNTPNYRTIFNLISTYRYDKNSKRYTFSIGQESIAVFFEGQFGYVNMKKRFQLSNNSNLGKWFQGFIAAHSKEEKRLTLHVLHELSAFTSRKDKFRHKLGLAINDLVSVGILEYGFIDGQDIIIWKKMP